MSETMPHCISHERIMRKSPSLLPNLCRLEHRSGWCLYPNLTPLPKVPSPYALDEISLVFVHSNTFDQGYTSLNRIQSIIYPVAYRSNENMLVCGVYHSPSFTRRALTLESAPTGAVRVVYRYISLVNLPCRVKLMLLC